MSNAIFLILRALWYMLPAYIANPSAVLFRGKVPMDFGRNFVDGRRILGKGKTWRGFFGGIFGGVFVGMIQNTISFFFPNELFPTFSDNFFTAFLIILSLASGSMLGDALGSFIKRRIGIESGGKGFLLDQWPFVFIAFLLTYIFFPDFFLYAFWNLPAIIFILFITPLLHRLVNIVGYKIGKKEVPW